MTSIVTGGAGFIGSHLVEELVRAGEQVISIDNFMRGSRVNLEDVKDVRSLEILEGDLMSSDFANKFVKNADTVYHLAAINGTKLFYERPRFVVETNLGSTQNVLSAAVRNGIKKVVFTSSSEVYGYPTNFPTTEESLLTYDGPSVTRWSYGVSKLCDEHLCYAYAKEFGLSIAILRIFNTYGPRLLGTPDGQVISIFMKNALAGRRLQIFGEGNQTRSFCYVSDTVDGIIKSGKYAFKGVELFNIGNEEEITIKELAKKVLETCNCQGLEIEYLPPLLGDSPRRVPSLKKARSLLGYEPRVNLQNGLNRTVGWFRMRSN